MLPARRQGGGGGGGGGGTLRRLPPPRAAPGPGEGSAAGQRSGERRG